MKDVIIQHNYKLSEILEAIKKEGKKTNSYEIAYCSMINKINEFLEIIK